MDKLILIPLTLITGLAVAYTLMLYAGSQQGQPGANKQAFFRLTLREIRLLHSHTLSVFGIAIIISILY
jgi:hypothetical protein